MGLNLLLIDSDPVLAADLRALGHSLTTGSDGKEALTAIGREQFDALILDRLLPGIDGVEIVARLRGEQITLPIVMISELARPVEKIAGLDAGADDYVVKPVTAGEIDARIRAILRGRQWTVSDTDTISAGDITISPGKYRAWRAGKPLDLARIELRLLAELARNADAVLSREAIAEHVWPDGAPPTANIVDAYIRRLRVKLTEHGGEDPIRTMRGVGYLLRG